MIQRIAQYKDRVIMDAIVPRIRWTQGEQPQKVQLVATEPATKA